MERTVESDLLDGGRKLPLVEDFYTIQGEGFHAGKPAYFIRLGGCDVGCSWCDAKYTWNPRLYPPVDVRTVVERATACAARVGRRCLLYLQPEWSASDRIMPLLVEYAKAHPQWNISIQTHKYMHIP